MDDKEARVVQGRYRLVRCVGEGSQGRVYLAEDIGRGGEQVAVKLVEAMVGGQRDNSADGILRWFRHPNWAPILDGGRWESDGWFQVSRYVRGSNLESLEGPQPESWVWSFLECGARALGALHRHGIIHYDVTPGNWMVEERGGEPSFVLTDGGLAHEGPVRGLGRGTPRFMAPEVTKDVEHDHRADLYSLGLVAYRLATGRDPFEGRAGEVLGKRRRKAAPSARVHRPDLDEGLSGVIDALLQRDPNARPDSGATLLELIAKSTSRQVPLHTPEEAAAAADGGPLVGRAPEVARFRDLCTALRPRLPSNQAPFVQRDVRRVQDSVFLLSGRRGSGTSRLLGELHQAARAHDLPAVSVSGRARWDETFGVLHALMAELQALEGQTTMRRARLDGKTHAVNHGAEALVALVSRVARQTPVVIFVEDYSQLSSDAQHLVQVLSRFLLARHDSTKGTSDLSAALVVDLGAHTPTDLLLSDTETPTKPVIELTPLDTQLVSRMCQERVPSLTLDDQGWRALSQCSEGLPGNLVSMIGEGLQRGDLAATGAEWSWDLTEISGYAAGSALSPADRLVLGACTRSERRALHVASLARGPVPARVLEAFLAEGESIEGLSGLLSINEELVSPPASSIAKTVDSSFTPEESRALASRAIEYHGVPALSRAHLMLAAERYQECSDTLLSSVSPSGGARSLLLHALREAGPLSSSDIEACSTWVGSDAASLALAQHLIQQERTNTSTDAVLQISRALEQHGHTTTALEFCSSQDLAGRPPVERYDLVCRCARLALAAHDLARADKMLRRARSLRRAVREMGDRRLAIVAVALATRCFYSGKPRTARRLFGYASQKARAAKSVELLAAGLNGLGISQQALGDYEAAERSMARAARFYRALGDINGALRARFNQARAAHLRGELVQGAATYQRVATLAARHRRNEALSRTLRALAHLYDQRLNSQLALRTLRRALREAENNRAEARLANAAWDIAPLAAAVGELDLCRQALVHSARHVRRLPSPFSRAQHHLARGLARLHAGDPAGAAQSCRRALRHDAALPDETRARLRLLLHCTSEDLEELAQLPLTPRPRRDEMARDAYRLSVWAARTRRAEGASRTIRLPGPTHLMPAQGMRPGVPGWLRRSYAELLLVGARKKVISRSSTLVQTMERNSKHSGERYLHARLVAAMCLLSGGGYQPLAQMFSKSVAALPRQTGRAANVVPHEHSRAALFVAQRMGFRQSSPQYLSELHAVAHQALLQSGGVAVADDRLPTALRSVLEATAMLNTGGDLETLLDTITRQVIEITGAERACVLRIATDGSHQVTTALSGAAETSDALSRPVSETVISRTMDARRPLLLHDVFDDEELMQRPSITSLSLRSIICVPIMRGERFYGVIYADDASAAAAFDQVDLEILSLYADQVAGMLEARRLLEELQDSMRELKTAQERLVRGERLRVIGEISSGVAHEFNNLLTGILARVQLAKLSPLPQALSNDLNLIEKAALDAAAIVRRLQGFSRSERRQGFTQIDFAEICKDAIDFLRPLWSGRGDVTRLRRTVRFIHDGPSPVLGNPTELRELVTNLLKNALDATSQGGTIELQLASDSKCVQLIVRDDGAGIPEEIRARVFDPFFTTKGERGTGLGLALCQQIVERHSGSLRVESEVGQGTSVLAELPSANTNRSSDTDVVKPEQQHLTILVVDDDSDVRIPLSDYLRRAGHEPIAATSAEDALALVEHRPIDVALIDVYLPGMSGLAFCAQLKADCPELGIILMSGRADELDVTKVRSAGAATLLSKPFAMQSVQRLLGQVAPQA